MKYFLLTYYRFITAHKRFAIVNFLSLSLAIAVILLMFMFVKSELTFDKFHKNSNRIFRLTTTLRTPGSEFNVAFANTAFAFKLRTLLPEISRVVCISEDYSNLVKYGDRVFRENNIRLATPGVFDMFSYKIINGEKKGLLTKPNTAVLTETLSNKLFGDEEPVGNTVSFDKQPYKVVGVMEDLPVNTALRFTALLSSPINGSEDINAWNDYYAYILLTDDLKPDFQSKIDRIADITYKPFFTGDNSGLSRIYKIQPLHEIHFDTSYLADTDTPKGNKTTVYVFLCVALLILIIACINYVNLNLAGALSRQKEFVIRRINGTGKASTLTYLLGESAINAVISIVLSLFIVMLLLPLLNSLTDADFSRNILTDPSIIALLFLMVVVIGILAGIYPSLFLFRLSESSKYAVKGASHEFNMARKALVMFQFVLSIAMICIITGVNRQYRYMQQYDLGYHNEQILSIDLSAVHHAPGKVESLKQDLSALYEVATGGPGTSLGTSGEWMRPVCEFVNEDGQEFRYILNIPDIDDNYLNLFGIELIDGRNFSKDHPSDYNATFIINQAYADLMGWKNPLNEKPLNDQNLSVIGVVKDFHFVSLHHKIEPLAFRFNDKEPAYIFVKALPAEVDDIRAVWQKYFTEEPFEFRFVSDSFQDQYQRDKKMKSLLGYLSFLAIFISALGLYGLTSFFITRRVKEIGIRKVNGARTAEILLMLNKDFIIMVAIAFIMAAPIAYYALNRWLESFAYKTPVNWTIFAGAGTIAMVVALFTLSWQSWKAASRNPVDSLRYE